MNDLQNPKEGGSNFTTENGSILKDYWQQLKILRYKYLIIPLYLSGGSCRKVLRIVIRDKKLCGGLCYFLEEINLISFILNSIAVETYRWFF